MRRPAAVLCLVVVALACVPAAAAFAADTTTTASPPSTPTTAPTARPRPPRSTLRRRTTTIDDGRAAVDDHAAPRRTAHVGRVPRGCRAGRRGRDDQVGNRRVPVLLLARRGRRSPAGATVTWTNTSGVEHTVARCTPAACNGASGGTGTDATFSKSTVAVPAGASFHYTFAQPGTYVYYCTLHGYAVMHGTITVTAAATTTTAAAAAPGAGHHRRPDRRRPANPLASTGGVARAARASSASSLLLAVGHRRAARDRSRAAGRTRASVRVDGSRDRRRSHRAARSRRDRRAAGVGRRDRGVAERLARVGPLRRADAARSAHLPHRERLGVSRRDRIAGRRRAAGPRRRARSASPRSRSRTSSTTSSRAAPATACTRTRSRTRASIASCRSSSRSTTAASSPAASGSRTACTRCCPSTTAASCAPTSRRRSSWFPAELAAGDAVLIDGLAPHYSEANGSEAPAPCLHRELRAGRARATAARTTTGERSGRMQSATERDGRFRISTLADFEGTEVASGPVPDACTHS